MSAYCQHLNTTLGWNVEPKRQQIGSELEKVLDLNVYDIYAYHYKGKSKYRWFFVKCRRCNKGVYGRYDAWNQGQCQESVSDLCTVM